MMKLDNFIGMMTGHFDNKEQFNVMQATGKISDCVSYDVLEKLRQEGVEVKMFVTPSEYYITDRYFGRMPYFAKPINTKCLGCRLIHKLQLNDNFSF